MPPRPSSPRRAPLIAAAVLLAALALLPASAPAMELQSFHTPSGNIRCLFVKAQGERSLRCDVYNATNTPPKGHCVQGDYGFSFGLRPTGRARRLCVSDAVDAGSVLPYGSSIKRYGMRCVSRTTGLRCRNRSGHGFRLAREAQRLF